jgi:hypothetical protein
VAVELVVAEAAQAAVREVNRKPIPAMLVPMSRLLAELLVRRSARLTSRNLHPAVAVVVAHLLLRNHRNQARSHRVGQQRMCIRKRSAARRTHRADRPASDRPALVNKALVTALGRSRRLTIRDRHKERCRAAVKEHCRALLPAVSNRQHLRNQLR